MFLDNGISDVVCKRGKERVRTACTLHLSFKVCAARRWGVWSSHTRGWWGCRLRLAVANRTYRLPENAVQRKSSLHFGGFKVQAAFLGCRVTIYAHAVSGRLRA